MESSNNATGIAEYEDYTSVSKTYDEMRKPVGLESLDKALELASQRLGKEKKSLKLLDVGCGTGNYINALKDKLGSCTGLEFNEGMLATAKAKHKNDKLVTIIQGSAAEEKCFETEAYDVVIMTQVLHHLSMDMQSKAFANIHRTIKPGGVFWLSSVTPEQILCGLWFSALIPQASATLGTKVPGIPLLKRQLATAGWKNVTIEVVKETLQSLDKYLDIQGPFDESYRKSDSTWSLATKEELEAGLLWWKEQIDLGLAEKFVKEHELVKRIAIGQSIAVTCVKET